MGQGTRKSHTGLPMSGSALSWVLLPSLWDEEFTDTL